MKSKKKNIKSFIREEDWKTIKKSLLMSSLWLVLWFWFINLTDAWHTSHDNHGSRTWANYHNSWHDSHNNHSSY